jgi:hypothetical protein
MREREIDRPLVGAGRKCPAAASFSVGSDKERETTINVERLRCVQASEEEQTAIERVLADGSAVSPAAGGPRTGSV